MATTSIPHAGPLALAASDDELVERHLRGDEVAFSALYAHHAEMVYNLALRMAGDPERAADWTQEVFLRVHRHLHRFEGRSSFKSWIYRITLNTCRSRLRRRALTFHSLADDQQAERLEDPRHGPEKRTLIHDEARQLQAALLELSPKLREAVVLCDVEHLAYEEIAEIVGVPLGTVRSRIYRGREQLRRLLEERAAEERAETPRGETP